MIQQQTYGIKIFFFNFKIDIDHRQIIDLKHSRQLLNILQINEEHSFIKSIRHR